jgi:spore maturation protein CgeB
MKILYIGIKHDYGKPERGFSFEHYNFYDALVKMEGGKHKVVYFSFDEIEAKHGNEKMNQLLLEEVEVQKPDLCFFILFGDEPAVKKETIKEITKSGNTITFNWFTDDHWRFDNFSKYWAPLFHWAATTDSQAPEKYKKIGYQNVIKTQWACNHFLYRPHASSFEYNFNVSFIGQPHGNRRQVISFLRNGGINVECFGYGWPKGSISHEDMIRVFSQSKINMNLSKSSGMGFKGVAKIFLVKQNERLQLVSPSKWGDNLRSLVGRFREQIKGRNFEIPGCRGFLVSGYADDLNEYYKLDEEIVCYKNNDDLVEKVRYYLSHEDEREKIAQLGYERTIGEHTYEKRFRDVFNKIGLSKK